MRYVFVLLLSSGAVILQSTIFKYISIAGVKPDLALIIILFIANSRGKLEGQVVGFGTGLIEDILSISPLGFHMFIKSFIGFIYGITKGTIFMDPLLMPVLLTVTGTVVKSLLAVLLSAIFSLSLSFSIVFSLNFLIELGYNAIIAPIIFALLSLIKPISSRRD
jgi:rod shape-determining protein MreD